VGHVSVAWVRIEQARPLWQPETVYLNTASYGLPPRPAWDALQAALADWRGGRTSWEHWGDSAEAARRTFARLCSVAHTHVAIGANASTMVGLVGGIPPRRLAGALYGARVHVGALALPRAGRGIETECVPAERLAEAIDGRTDVVVFSAVQSSDGRVADRRRTIGGWKSSRHEAERAAAPREAIAAPMPREAPVTNTRVPTPTCIDEEHPRLPPGRGRSAG
jgi:hypothetical protein